MLILVAQPSDSAMHLYTFFFTSPSTAVYPRTLSVAPCATHQDCVYPSCIHELASAKPRLPRLPSLPHLVTTSLFLCLCESGSILQIHLLVSCFRVSSVIWYASFSVCLTSLRMIISGCIHVPANSVIPSCLWLSNIPLYIHTTSSLFICRWTFKLLACLGYCE